MSIPQLIEQDLSEWPLQDLLSLARYFNVETLSPRETMIKHLARRVKSRYYTNGTALKAYMLSDLPAEMIEELCNKMDLQTLTRFVRTNKQYYQVCKEILEKKKPKLLASDPDLYEKFLAFRQDNPGPFKYPRMNLKAFIEYHDVSYRRLADALGVDQSSFYRWINYSQRVENSDEIDSKVRQLYLTTQPQVKNL